MAIEDDFSINPNGDIRHVSGTTNYLVIDFHRYLGALSDDGEASGDDILDISSDTASDRSTDQIITLLGAANIDDNAAEFLYGGSITQDNGNTRYSGLQVLGSVNSSTTQLMVIQDNDLYQFTTTPATPFWGDQSTGGYNGDAAASVLMRCLIKSRVNGADINNGRIRVQARHWGDSYSFFPVDLGLAESVAAINTAPDPQNTTSQGTVTAYTHVTNVEGFQTIDLNNGNGPQEYYSKWTFGADTSSDGLKGMWEFTKDLTGNGTAKTIHGQNGELFVGITHSFAYDAETGGPFTEDEVLAWGTEIDYDTEAGGPFTVGEYVTIGVLGAAGKLVDLDDQGTTGTIVVALEDTSITLVDGDTITGLSSAATADINVTITDNDKSGGTGILLALDDDGTTGNFYIELISGVAPVNDLRVIGNSSNATALVNGAPTSRAVQSHFVGTYTGTLIGAYGLGVDENDLTASDSIEDLSGTTQTPPNNVTFTVTGLVSGEDRILVGPRAAGILEKNQFLTITPTLVSGSTVVNVNAAIATDAPVSGDIRVQDDLGIYRETPYASYAGSAFTLTGTYGHDAAIGNEVFIAYIDELAGAATAAFTSVYLADRDLFVRDRDGGATPIKTFEAPAQLTASGGTIAVIRTSDA